MAQCVVIVGDTLAPSAADPCTGFLVLTPAEYGVVANSPFNISAEDGAVLATAIVGVWAVAWAARALWLALGDDSQAGQEI